MKVSKALDDRGASNWADTHSDIGVPSRPRAVATRTTVAASALVVGLLATESLLPGVVAWVVDFGAVITLGALLVLYEFGRRDVSAARSELFRSEQRLSFAQAAAGIGSWEVDPDGEEFWSPSFRDLLGVDALVPASTASFRAAVHPDDQDAVALADAEMLTEPGKHEFEYRVVRNDGEVRSLLARGVCIVDDAGGGQRALGVAIDLTERKANEQTNRLLELKLTQAQRLDTIGRLAGGIAHDFNNLLTGINGYADLARSRLDEGHSPREEIEEIRAGESAPPR